MKANVQADPRDFSSLDAASFFRIIFEQAAVGVAQIETATGRFLHVNQRYGDIVGYSREEMERLVFQTLTHPGDLAADLDNMRRMVAGETRAFTMEKRYRHKDGHFVWVNLTVSPLWAPGEPPKAHIAVVEDITARKQAEASLHQQAVELSALNTLSRLVNASLSLAETTKAALAGMLDAVQPDLAFLFLRDGERLILHEILPSTARTRLEPVPEHRVGGCVCGLAVRERKPLYSRDIFTDLRCTWEECKRAGIKSFAALPLFSGGEVIGVIGLASDTERDFERQGGFLETLAGQVSAALQNARLYEAAQRELAARKQAEEALRESRHILRIVLDTIPVRVFWKDAALNYLGCNQPFAEDAGLASVADVVGKDDFGMAWSEQSAHYRADDQQVMASGQPRIGYEEPQTSPDGSRLWIRTSKVPLRDLAGRVYGILGTYEDITEHKRAEEALRASESLLRAVVDNIPFEFWARDMEGRCTMENAALRAHWGSLLGQRPEDSGIAAGELAVWLANNRRALAGEILKEEVSYQVRGETRFYQNILVPIRVGDEILGSLGFNIDITERKRAEQALQQSEKRLQLVMRGSQLGYWDWNLETNEVNRNERWAEMLDYDLHEIEFTVKQWIDFVHPDDRVAANQSIQDHVAGRTRMHRCEYRMRTKAGVYKWILDQAQVVSRDPNGRALRMSGTHTDITERKRAEEEREKLQAQLTQAQKMESVGRLAGGVAHDFNNMLQAILGNAALALEEIPPDSPVREGLEEIQKSAERSADLTRQLLAFARKQTIAPKVLDINDTVEGMLKMLRRLIGENIHLAWLPGADLWRVKMDPSQLDQILANLCVNARDAIADTGRITMETSNVVLDDTCMQSHPDCVPGNYVLLAVSDTGHGMDADTRAHLFEPFFTTKGVGKGTGLGLATVFGIVKQNHGLINVYSEPGRGTTFKIYLPRAEAETVAAAEVAQPRPLRGSETVLLVEDEGQILNLGKRILQRQGYAVLSAPSPEAALALAARQAGPIHLLVTDVVMPGMNGKELAGRLRASHPGLKCLFMSGYTADVIAHHGVLDAGVAFVQKPFTIQTLAEKVREVLEAHREPPRQP